MASGLLFSVFAGFVAQGVIPGAVAAGALAVVWIPIITTVETGEDLLSVVAARLLERHDPGRVLVIAEAYTCACAVASATAVALRILAVRVLRTAERAPEHATTASPLSPATSRPTISGDRPLTHTVTEKAPVSNVLRSTVAGSPLPSFLSNLSSAAVAAYVSLWAVRESDAPNERLVIPLLAIGIGSTLGPFAARWVERFGRARLFRALLLFRVVTLGCIAVVAISSHPGLRRVLITAGLMLLLAAATVASAVVQATARQWAFQGDALSQMVGWSHSAAAAGSLTGVWTGAILAVQTFPVASLAVAAVAAVIAAIIVT